MSGLGWKEGLSSTQLQKVRSPSNPDRIQDNFHILGGRTGKEPDKSQQQRTPKAVANRWSEPVCG